MQPITFETTVGELIPEGKYCKPSCPFAYFSVFNSEMSCNLKHVTWQADDKMTKHPACPKPPCEVKK